jgi:hypothetical protein
MTINLTDLFNAFDRAMKNAGGVKGARVDQLKEFLDIVRSDPGYLDAFAIRYFDQNVARWIMGARDKNSEGLVATPSHQARAEKALAAQQERGNVLKKMIAEIQPFIWLEMLMPNGKKLRYCTGAELRKFGGVFIAFADELGPTEVVDKHLNNEALCNIASRFETTRPRGGGGTNREMRP